MFDANGPYALGELARNGRKWICRRAEFGELQALLNLPNYQVESVRPVGDSYEVVLKRTW